MVAVRELYCLPTSVKMEKMIYVSLNLTQNFYYELGYHLFPLRV